MTSEKFRLTIWGGNAIIMQYFRFGAGRKCHGVWPRFRPSQGKGGDGRLKKSLLGLGFGVLLMLLMLAAMVSAPAEEEIPPPPKPAPVCGLQPLRPAEANGEMPPAKRASVRSETALPQTRPAAPACPSADANGVPLLRQTYRRANFRAFHYSDEAG